MVSFARRWALAVLPLLLAAVPLCADLRVGCAEVGPSQAAGQVVVVPGSSLRLANAPHTCCQVGPISGTATGGGRPVTAGKARDVEPLLPASTRFSVAPLEAGSGDRRRSAGPSSIPILLRKRSLLL